MAGQYHLLWAFGNPFLIVNIYFFTLYSVCQKTVRLMVNYHGSQKAVVRVNPFVPLQTLLPVICEKCDFDPAHVLLLKDSVSRHELQLDKSLTDLGIKELYVHDQSLGKFHWPCYVPLYLVVIGRPGPCSSVYSMRGGTKNDSFLVEIPWLMFVWCKS